MNLCADVNLCYAFILFFIFQNEEGHSASVRSSWTTDLIKAKAVPLTGDDKNDAEDMGNSVSAEPGMDSIRTVRDSTDEINYLNDRDGNGRTVPIPGLPGLPGKPGLPGQVHVGKRQIDNSSNLEMSDCRTYSDSGLMVCNYTSIQLPNDATQMPIYRTYENAFPQGSEQSEEGSDEEHSKDTISGSEIDDSNASGIELLGSQKGVVPRIDLRSKPRGPIIRRVHLQALAIDLDDNYMAVPDITDADIPEIYSPPHCSQMTGTPGQPGTPGAPGATVIYTLDRHLPRSARAVINRPITRKVGPGVVSYPPGQGVPYPPALPGEYGQSSSAQFDRPGSYGQASTGLRPQQPYPSYPGGVGYPPGQPNYPYPYPPYSPYPGGYPSGYPSGYPVG